MNFVGAAPGTNPLLNELSSKEKLTVVSQGDDRRGAGSNELDGFGSFSRERNLADSRQVA